MSSLWRLTKHSMKTYSFSDSERRCSESLKIQTHGLWLWHLDKDTTICCRWSRRVIEGWNTCAAMLDRLLWFSKVNFHVIHLLRIRISEKWTKLRVTGFDIFTKEQISYKKKSEDDWKAYWKGTYRLILKSCLAMFLKLLRNHLDPATMINERRSKPQRETRQNKRIHKRHNTFSSFPNFLLSIILLLLLRPHERTVLVAKGSIIGHQATPKDAEHRFYDWLKSDTT